MRAPASDPIEVHYIDGAGEPQNVDFTSVEAITVQKNTYMFICVWGSSSTANGNIVRKYYCTGHVLYYVAGDGTLVCSD